MADFETFRVDRDDPADAIGEARNILDLAEAAISKRETAFEELQSENETLKTVHDEPSEERDALKERVRELEGDLKAAAERAAEAEAAS